MAKISELTSLFTAISNRDWQQARAHAEEIAIAEEKAGHHSAASILRGALNATGPRPERGRSAELPSSDVFAIPPELLVVLDREELLVDVTLTEVARNSFGEILAENRHRGPLLARGLRPRNRLLFYGPPGCGKTLTATALGNELHLPVCVVRFDALVGSYLGQTSMRMHEIFRYAEVHPCVLLIDEIDAIGRRRGKPSDVGELDRVVISLMQHLDLARPAGLILAATNIVDELDPALIRRFDLAVEFPAPTSMALRDFSKREASSRGLSLSPEVRKELTSAKTFADVRRIIDTEQRRSILREM